MQVLRDNKESLMAVLEAFVYDPLINWRLMQTTEVEVRRTDGDYAACCITLPKKLIPTPLQALTLIQNA